ncbi:MAG: DUF732 domain-containing protein [Actinomycetota bacterium]|nr:DUF732 domain-containing protein [Actinomycetota bacterium]
MIAVSIRAGAMKAERSTRAGPIPRSGTAGGSARPGDSAKSGASAPAGTAPRHATTARLVCGLTIAAALAGACSGPSGPPPAASQAFLLAVHAAYPSVNQQRSDESLVRLGEAACAEFSSGASFTAVAGQLQSSGLAPEELGTLLTAAVDDLCPKYRAAADGP